MIYIISQQCRIDSDIIKNGTIEQLLEFCKDKSELGLDTETMGFDPHRNKLLSIQIGNYEDQFLIDCNILTKELIQILKELLESSMIWLIQNAQFDLRFFYHLNIKPKNIYDTFLAECILTTGFDTRGLGLKDLGLKYCNIELDKSTGGQIHREGLSDRVIIYGCNDVKYLSLIKEKQLVEIEKWGLQRVLELENEVVKVFALMCYNGIPFNPSKWIEVAEETEKQTKLVISKLDSIIYTIGTKDLPKVNFITKYCNIYKQGNLFGSITDSRNTIVNWSSNTQKLKILKDLGIHIDSVGDRELQKAKKKHELIPLLIEYSKSAKLVSSFGKEFLKFINPITKRIHPEVWQILSTGRISVSNPNINQIPSHGELATKIRASFEAPEGYKIVGGDYSGMELRILAEFSQDPTWLGVFNRGGDLHSELCAMTFGIPLTDVKKPFPPKPEFKYRDVQKTVDFGLSYGMSKFKLSDTLQIKVDKAEDIINKFFSIVPKVKKFLVTIGNLGKTRGYIKTAKPFSRIRWYQQWQTAIDTGDLKVLGEIERASMNTPIQGTNADIVKTAMINIQKIIDGNDYPVQIVMQIYDEIQTVCREEFAEEWRTILEQEMIKAAQIVIKSIPVEVDCKISQYWSK
jgi:DNA polymerase I-like protein with 3'-5' exonuclease and polymerase domains